ncbi:ribonucleoside hydrolase [candidate division KSB3 bacterium]|uniref:Ribonucleoside hydrolase n=1 Tax=candidate division KSB3 bacterium TaxID=2044937 RepID=A0A9D5JUU9_9BACT|nr:ribonucleoside hydrolase [candidate division KSB3 bacterium]MBD3324677.1 ribonucleoside hydrolase [candidate division KSB3 bacterium]
MRTVTPNKKVILDCDPGHDDAVALVLTARSPELDVVGVTCVAGNVDVEKTAANALKICALAGMEDVPVVKGMAQPLFGELQTATHVHGKTGLDGARFPEPEMSLHPGHAVDFLINRLLASDGDITLIPIGPLTNIAMAMLQEPRIIPKIPQIVLMGGAMGMGNVTPSAEFNIYVDPEAAKVVFESGVPVVMLGLDVTHSALLTPDHLAAIQAHGTPLTEVFSGLLTFYLNRFASFGHPEGAVLHDPCAVAAVCDPSLLTTQLMRVDIETKGEFTRGRTVCDPKLKSGKDPNVRVGVAFDAERFFEMLLSRLK